MNVREKLQNTKLSNTESNILQFLFESGESIKEMSIYDVAKANFVSPSLVVRMAHKLGYTGWTQLRLGLIRDIECAQRTSNVNMSIPFHTASSYFEIAQTVSLVETNVIRETFHRLDTRELTKAMTVLTQCDDIVIFGQNFNTLISQEFQQNMLGINKRVRVCSLPGNEKIMALTLSERTCVIAISCYKNSDYYKYIVKHLKESHTPIISICLDGDEVLTSAACTRFQIYHAPDSNVWVGNFAMSVSVKYILDVLYGCYFSTDFENNLAMNKRIIEQVHF